MSLFRAIVICQKYFGNHVILSQIQLFAPLLNMRRCTLWNNYYSINSYISLCRVDQVVRRADDTAGKLVEDDGFLGYGLILFFTMVLIVHAYTQHFLWVVYGSYYLHIGILLNYVTPTFDSSAKFTYKSKWKILKYRLFWTSIWRCSVKAMQIEDKNQNTGSTVNACTF